MSGEFGVHPGELSAGAGRVHGLVGSCQSLSQELTRTVADMVGAAGNPALEQSLTAATEAVAKTMLDSGALLQHIGDGLAASGREYASTDARHTAALAKLDIWTE